MPGFERARLQPLKSRPGGMVRVELAFRPASQPFISLPSRLQPAAHVPHLDFFSGLFSRAGPRPRKTWSLGPEVKIEGLMEFVKKFLFTTLAALRLILSERPLAASRRTPINPGNAVLARPSLLSPRRCIYND